MNSGAIRPSPSASEASGIQGAANSAGALRPATSPAKIRSPSPRLRCGPQTKQRGNTWRCQPLKRREASTASSRDTGGGASSSSGAGIASATVSPSWRTITRPSASRSAGIAAASGGGRRSRTLTGPVASPATMPGEIAAVGRSRRAAEARRDGQRDGVAHGAGSAPQCQQWVNCRSIRSPQPRAGPVAQHHRGRHAGGRDHALRELDVARVEHAELGRHLEERQLAEHAGGVVVAHVAGDPPFGEQVAIVHHVLQAERAIDADHATTLGRAPPKRAAPK